MVAGTLSVTMATRSTDQLVREAQAFSQEAWARLYDQYYGKIFSYCYLRTGNRAASEDLAADVFLEALRGIERYRYRGVPLSAWLYRIARNLTADHLRHNAQRPTVPLAAEDEHVGPAAHDDIERSALRQDVQDALGRLTEDQQQVIVLRFFQGLSHQETAAVMGRRSGAVRVLQDRALKALRRHMVA